METIRTDVKDLETGFETAIAERDRKESPPTSLTEFLVGAQPKIASLRESLKLAEYAFQECAEFYGESAKTLPDTFFTRLTNFVKHFEQASVDMETKKKDEQVGTIFLIF